MSEVIEIIAANQNLISMPKYRWSAVRLMDQVRDEEFVPLAGFVRCFHVQSG